MHEKLCGLKIMGKPMEISLYSLFSRIDFGSKLIAVAANLKCRQSVMCKSQSGVIFKKREDMVINQERPQECANKPVFDIGLQ